MYEWFSRTQNSVLFYMLILLGHGSLAIISYLGNKKMMQMLADPAYSTAYIANPWPGFWLFYVYFIVVVGIFLLSLACLRLLRSKQNSAYVLHGSIVVVVHVLVVVLIRFF